MYKKIMLITALAFSSLLFSACSFKNLKSQEDGSDISAAEDTSVQYYDPTKIGPQYYENETSEIIENKDLVSNLNGNILTELDFKHDNTLIDSSGINICLNKIRVDTVKNRLIMDFGISNEQENEINVKCSYFTIDDAEDCTNYVDNDFSSSLKNDIQSISVDLSAINGWPKDNDIRKIGTFCIKLELSGDVNCEGDTILFPVMSAYLASNSQFDSLGRTYGICVYASDISEKSNSTSITINVVNNSDIDILYDAGEECNVNDQNKSIDTIITCNAGDMNISTLKINEKIKSGDIITLNGLIRDISNNDIIAENVDLTITIP